jgi:hypothetical protein
MIQEYSFGRIKINGKVFHCDVIICQNNVESWWRQVGHEVNIKDIEKLVFEKKPKYIVFGTGAAGLVCVGEEVEDLLKRCGIKFFIKLTKEAVEVYNDLLNKGEDVAACLHLTC